MAKDFLGDEGQKFLDPFIDKIQKEIPAKTIRKAEVSKQNK